MLPIALVLFLAASAIAAPSVNFSLRSINEVAPHKNNGKAGWLLNNAMENPDNGEHGAYILTAQQILTDLGNSNDLGVQALALSQGLAMLTKLSTGIPGDSCASASLIDAVVNAARSGNPGAARGAVANYIQALVQEIDGIAQLAINPEGRRFAIGRRGNCNGGGSVYNFEAAWDLARSSISPSAAGLIQEQYCAVKRLYNGFNVVSRNVAAAATAAVQRPIVDIFRQVTKQASNFLSAIGNGSPQAGQAGRALGKALLGALNNIAY